MNLKGIDVSCWNGTADWQKVKVAGVQFAMIRAGFGNDASQVDSQFKANIEGALAVGLHVGVYWMSYATSTADAVAEAKVVKQIITKYSGKIDFPVCFDWEYASEDYFVKQIGRHPTDTEISNMVVAFCGELKKGCWYAANYQNLDFTAHKLDSDIVKDINVWLADYSGGPDIACGMQQTAEDGCINGVRGHVDTDTAFVDYPSIIKAAGLNGLKKADAVPFKSDTPQATVLMTQPKYTILFSKSPDSLTVKGRDRIKISNAYKDARGRGWLVDVFPLSAGGASVTAISGQDTVKCGFTIK